MIDVLFTKTFYNENKLNKLLTLSKETNCSAIKLANTFHCNRKTIHKALNINGIFIENSGKFKKIFCCNEDFFGEENETSAYWLGFIAADGTVHKKRNLLRIGLNEKDRDHLHKFKEAINATNPINYTETNRCVSISIYSKKIVKTGRKRNSTK